jgi:hypothetical protein
VANTLKSHRKGAVGFIELLGRTRLSLAYTGESVCSCYSRTVGCGCLQLDNQLIVHHTHVSNICAIHVGRRNRSFKLTFSAKRRANPREIFNPPDRTLRRPVPFCHVQAFAQRKELKSEKVLKYSANLQFVDSRNI